MQRQKRVALINDVTGFGRCSIASLLPIISSMKIQGVIIPTAILSADTYIDGYYFEDFTDKMDAYIKTYKDLSLTFDGICTGFLGSCRQVEIVIDFLSTFTNEDTFVLVDPVMGDHGALYPVYTKEMIANMRLLIPYAKIMTPNITELCALLEIPYPSIAPTHDTLEMWCSKLSMLGPENIVVTGIKRGKYIENYIYQSGQISRQIVVKQIGQDRFGTGDVFCGVLTASYTNGLDFYQSVKKAVQFTDKCIKYSEALQTPYNYGLCFEEFLKEL